MLSESLASWEMSMQAVVPHSSRGAFRRQSSFAAALAARTERADAFVVPTPRCLGELRLADLLRAGEISVAEFEAERTALLARL